MNRLRSVLIVDDSRFMRNYIKAVAMKYGFTVVGEAADGQESVAMFTELRPDIVTMDIVMPKMDGLDALRHIMDMDARAKVIMVTSMGQGIIMQEAMTCGARGFVVKPLREELLLSALERA